MASSRAREESHLDVGLTTGAVRAILAAPGTGSGRAEDLARRLGDAIRVGLILDGERLPSEARLAAQLGVASVTLREVLRILRGEGLITTRRGHGGGTVVTAPANRSASFDTRLSRLSLVDIRDLGDQRLAIFTAAAELAADRALSLDVDRMRSHVTRFVAGRDAGELRRADSMLSVEVAAAAQSSRLAREDLRLRAEVGDLLWMRPSDHEVAQAAAARTRLVDAIASRDRLGARSAARDVIDQDTRRLLNRRLAAYYAGPRRVGGTPGPLAALQDELRSLTDSLVGLSAGFLELLADRAPESPLRRKDLASLHPAITDVLERHRGTLIGAGVVVRPGLLEDAERWLEWLWTSPDGRLEPLRINLEPAAPDFYDYVVTSWYQHPIRSGRPEVTGPYVDASCTGEYVLTLSVPVTVDGEPLGVVAGDVSVGVVEAVVIESLRSTGRPAVLVSREGRVMVSTDERHVPGALLAPEHEDLLDVHVFAEASAGEDEEL